MFVRIALAGVLAAALLVVAPAAQATYLGENGKIAYQRGGEVWTMAPDGSDQALLLTDASNPAWSPDGRRIASGCEVFGIYGSNRICTAAADGTSRTTLDNFGYDLLGDPSWSPDGRHLAVAQDYGCDHHVCFAVLLRIDSADGSDPIEIGYGVRPSWGVNRRIAYVTRAVTGPDPGSLRLVTDILVVNPSAPTQSALVPGTDDGYSPDWSPNGERLVFTLGSDIYVVNRDGSNLTRLTETTESEVDPTWSPDGTKIAFPRFGTNWDIWVMNADGTGTSRLTDTPEVNELAPAWQPLPQDAYPVPASAPAMRVSLVPAFEPCAAANRVHGPPLGFDSCAPPRSQAGFMTFGPKAVGHVRLGVIPGDPDSVNRADVTVSATLRDVRRGFDLADGPGSLELVLPVRITDMSSGPFDSEHQATVVDLDDYLTNPPPLRFLLPCVETADPKVGSTCGVNTTVNALYGSSVGVVRERRRAIWALDQVAVWDGGEDGFIESRDDNTVLAVQGVFVP